MSNNPNWKRQLQDKINEHNRQHGSKPKRVSNETVHASTFSLLHTAASLSGYQIDLNRTSPGGISRCSLTTGPAMLASPTGVGSAA